MKHYLYDLINFRFQVEIFVFPKMLVYTRSQQFRQANFFLGIIKGPVWAVASDKIGTSLSELNTVRV